MGFLLFLMDRFARTARTDPSRMTNLLSILPALAHAVQERLQIVRQRHLPEQFLLGPRMRETKFRRVQGHARGAAGIGDQGAVGFAVIDLVAADGMTEF